MRSPSGRRNVNYSELEVENIQQPSLCCLRCRVISRGTQIQCISLITVAALLSLLGSLTFFGIAGYLVYETVERSFSLFVMAVLFFAETIGFAKYSIDIIMLRRDKCSWHSKRVWVPFFDAYIVSIGITASTTLLPCGMLGDLWHQLYLLDDIYYYLVIVCTATTLLKLITAVVLTSIHVLRVLALQRNLATVPDYENYPYGRNVMPTAPEE
jgi:hypothetical protein